MRIARLEAILASRTINKDIIVSLVAAERFRVNRIRLPLLEDLKREREFLM